MTEAVDTLEVALDKRFIRGAFKDKKSGLPHGQYFVKVAYKDAVGEYQHGMLVTFDRPDDKRDPQTIAPLDTQSEKRSKDWYHVFDYMPTSKGNKTLVFTCNGITTELKVNVR